MTATPFLQLSIPFFTPSSSSGNSFFFLISPSDHGDFAEGNMTALHASGQTTLHFPGGRTCAFHIWLSSTLVTVDEIYGIHHSSCQSQCWNGDRAALMLWFQFLLISTVMNCFSFAFCLSSRAGLRGGREALFGGDTYVCALVPALYFA